MNVTARRSVLVLICLVGFGCDGWMALDSSQEPSPTGSPSQSPPAAGTPRDKIDKQGGNTDPENALSDDVCKFVDPGQTPLRRLTHIQYNNTVEDLFPELSVPSQSLMADEKQWGQTQNVSAAVGDAGAVQYRDAAEAIADQAADHLDKVVGCDDRRNDACMRTFLKSFVPRAYRRPVTTDEIDRLMELFDWGQSKNNFKYGVQVVLEGILQAPDFLYRLEAGVDSDQNVVKLSDHELASRLSYFLWNTMPDAQLRSVADAGNLSDPAVVEKQARRMIDDPRARRSIDNAVMNWLKLGTFDERANHVPKKLRHSMKAETRALVDHVLWEGDGRLSTLLTATYTFVDSRMADFYGIQGPDGDGMVRVDLASSHRQGILTHASILARHGVGEAQIHRGKFIQKAFMCNTTPPPPNELMNPPETFPEQALRSRSEDRLAHPQCGTCHAYMDPIGLVFSNYDDMGRWRQEDDYGHQLSADGAIHGAGDLDGNISGASALAERLAGSQQVADCVVKQWFRIAFARKIKSADACSQHVMEQAYEQAGDDMIELLVATTTTDAFRYRRALDSGPED